MHEETVGSKIVKWVLIGVSVLFLVLMLLLPLLTVISEALRDGWKTYQAAVTDKYTVKAVSADPGGNSQLQLVSIPYSVFLRRWL